MIENENSVQRAILVAADCGDWDAEVSIDELEELAKSAGAEVVAKVIQVRKDYDKATLIGRGKLDEVRELADANDADILIFDHELTAANIRNLALHHLRSAFLAFKDSSTMVSHRSA